MTGGRERRRRKRKERGRRREEAGKAGRETGRSPVESLCAFAGRGRGRGRPEPRELQSGPGVLSLPLSGAVVQYNIAADTGREEEDITFQAIATGGQQEERLGKERGGLGSIRGEV